MSKSLLTLFLICNIFTSLNGTDRSIQSVVHPFIESLGKRDSGFIHAWIYFKDKGMKQEDKADALFQAERRLSERVRWRRLKTSRGEIVSEKDIPVFESYISSVVGTGTRLRHRSKWLNAISIIATREQLENISKFNFVSKIDPVLVHKRPVEKYEENKQMNQKTILNHFNGDDDKDSSFYGVSKEQIEQINCHLAHEAGYRGQDVLVLVLDTGYFKDHESIQKERIVAEWDFINNDGNTQNEEGDTLFQHHHGTYTLSAMGGFKRWKLIGPAYQAKFLLAKTEMLEKEIQQEEDNFVAALEWGESHGADVASSSLTYLDWYSYCDMDGNTAITTRAVDIAVSLGIVCVTGAGNWGNKPKPDDPCFDPLTYYISAPADADSVIAVGAVHGTGQIAHFSSKGPTYDGRIKPEVCARGVSTACASASASDAYAFLNGTSLSTPLVSGAAAVVLSAHPNWSPMEVREALMKTASQADFPDNTYGYGIINVWDAIHYPPLSEKYGPPLPSELFLAQNYPNPFNNITTIHYVLPKASDVSLTVFNLMGEKVDMILQKRMETGQHFIHWNGSRFTSGIYLISLKAGDITQTRKMILLK